MQLKDGNPKVTILSSEKGRAKTRLKGVKGGDSPTKVRNVLFHVATPRK